MSRCQKQLRSSIPESHNNRVQIRQRLQWIVKQPGESHIGYFDTIIWSTTHKLILSIISIKIMRTVQFPVQRPSQVCWPASNPYVKPNSNANNKFRPKSDIISSSPFLLQGNTSNLQIIATRPLQINAEATNHWERKQRAFALSLPDDTWLYAIDRAQRSQATATPGLINVNDAASLLIEVRQDFRIIEKSETFSHTFRSAWDKNTRWRLITFGCLNTTLKTSNKPLSVCKWIG